MSPSTHDDSSGATDAHGGTGDAGRTRPDVAVVVVNYGSHHLLAQNLDGLAPEVRVVVVDNHTTDEERRALTRLGATHGWDVLPLATNVGFGSGTNLGVDHARRYGCRTFVLVNPDLELPVEVLRELVATSRRDPSTMVSPRVVRPDGTVWFAGGQVLVDAGRTITAGADSSAPGGWLTGACLTVGTELWQASGGFDDDYFLYWEDIDLSWRWVGAGGRLLVREDLSVVHDVGGTQGAGKSATYLRFNARNRLLFAAKHLSTGQQWRWVLRSATYARLLLRRAGATRGVHRHGPAMAAVARGTVEGTWFVVLRTARSAAPRRRPRAM